MSWVDLLKTNPGKHKGKEKEGSGQAPTPKHRFAAQAPVSRGVVKIERGPRKTDGKERCKKATAGPMGRRGQCFKHEGARLSAGVPVSFLVFSERSCGANSSGANFVHVLFVLCDTRKTFWVFPANSEKRYCCQ